ncbi:uncharacterized protein V2V93DRAFT_375978 [Kockiozyma suomiensis]|uniref:uncharacterized protein n=1 Tax=Kockiozyma suomiensis TaxID=1337062 RepID=UPI00334370D1
MLSSISILRQPASRTLLRSFSTSLRLQNTAASAPAAAAAAPVSPAPSATAAAKRARKPVGGFRGAILGFFAGTTFTGLVGYFYVLDVYRDSNTLLLEDLVELQRHVSKLESEMKK